MLLSVLHATYEALVSFAAATLVALVGAAAPSATVRLLAFGGVALGSVGGVCLIAGTVHPHKATQISSATVRDEAAITHERNSALR